MKPCSICRRNTPDAYFERHHKDTRKKSHLTIGVCCDCGDMLHELFTNTELKTSYNTLEALLANDRVQKWIRWVRKKPDEFGVCMKAKKRR